MSRVCTKINLENLLFQGDMDKTGAVFDKVVSTFSSGDITPYWDQFNPTHSGWGSHVRLLTAAALSTTGDILELGTGFFSTPLLHQIVKEEVSWTFHIPLQNDFMRLILCVCKIWVHTLFASCPLS